MDHCFGFVIKSKNKYLICHPFGHAWKDGSWSLPKGHSRSGESDLQAALRETREETGLDLKKEKGKISRLGTFLYPKKRKKITAFLFEGKPNLRFKKTTCSSKITKGKHKGKPEVDFSKWVSLEEAKSKLHLSAIPVLNTLKDK